MPWSVAAAGLLFCLAFLGWLILTSLDDPSSTSGQPNQIDSTNSQPGLPHRMPRGRHGRLSAAFAALLVVSASSASTDDAYVCTYFNSSGTWTQPGTVKVFIVGGGGGGCGGHGGGGGSGCVVRH